MRALLWNYAFAYRREWAIGLLFSAGSTAFGLFTPWLLRQAIDTFSSGSSQLGWALEAVALAIMAAAMLEAVCRFFSRLVITAASRWVEYDLRNRYFEHLETLEPAFFVRFRTGDLVARGINDLSAVRQLFGPALYNVLNTVLLFCVALVLMFQLSVDLAKWAALVLPLVTLVFAVSRSRIEERFTRVQEQFAAMSDHALETFGGQRVVKAYTQEPAEIEMFRKTSQEYVRRQLNQIRLTGVFWPTMPLLLGRRTVFLLDS